jgi:hypothetical protein
MREVVIVALAGALIGIMAAAFASSFFAVRPMPDGRFPPPWCATALIQTRILSRAIESFLAL